MGAVRSTAIRTAGIPSHALACRAYALMTEAVPLTEPRATYFRKLRAPSQEPNPLARLMAHMSELAGVGAPEAALRQAVLTINAHLDALFGHTRTLDTALLIECATRENEENAAEVAVMCGDRSLDTLRRFAKAKRREASLDMVAADAADMEAAKLVRGVR
jgi:hypothetical protein